MKGNASPQGKALPRAGYNMALQEVPMSHSLNMKRNSKEPGPRPCPSCRSPPALASPGQQLQPQGGPVEQLNHEERASVEPPQSNPVAPRL